MGELSALPNISKVIESKLNTAGIETIAQFYEAGSREVFLSIRKTDETACISMLYGLEGAIQGIRWHGLSQETKDSLKKFFREIPWQ